jgi:hypothetical protein
MVSFGRNLRGNKRGSLIDLLFIGGLLFFFGIIVLVGLKIATMFETNIDASPIFDVGESRSAVENVRVKYTNTIDNTFLFLTIFLGLGTLILAALVVVHPIFIPFYFIGWVLVIFFSAILSNMYQTMAADANLSAVAGEIGIITNILTALPIIVGVFGIILMIVMYKIRGYNVG